MHFKTVETYVTNIFYITRFLFCQSNIISSQVTFLSEGAISTELYQVDTYSIEQYL